MTPAERLREWAGLILGGLYCAAFYGLIGWAYWQAFAR
jgi:hypothetical protein